MYNPNKTISANSKGIVVSFGDVNKHKFIKYELTVVTQIQLYGTVKYQKIEQSGFNSTQEKLFAEAMYGLNFYTAAEIKVMPVEKKRHIVKSITYRIISTLTGFLTIWWISGSIKVGTAFGVVELIYKPIQYYIHERIWYKWIKFGLKDKK